MDAQESRTSIWSAATSTTFTTEQAKPLAEPLSPEPKPTPAYVVVSRTVAGWVSYPLWPSGVGVLYGFLAAPLLDNTEPRRVRNL